MTELVKQGANSPFDEIKHTDEHGDWWSARELMPLMAYPRWQEFLPVIERAKAAALNQGIDPDEVFRVIPENPHKQGGRPGKDVRMTRIAAYLVAMNGDPRKEEVAAAQTYFAMKTREAEIRPKLSGNLAVLEGMLYELHQTQHRVGQVEIEQRHQGARQGELEARVDSIEGRSDWYTALAYCKIKRLPSHLSYRQRVGAAATKLAQQAGVDLPKVPDERYGVVNKYPEWALERAVEQMESANAGA